MARTLPLSSPVAVPHHDLELAQILLRQCAGGRRAATEGLEPRHREGRAGIDLAGATADRAALGLVLGSGQFAASAQASRRTQAPICLMRPVSSAVRMMASNGLFPLTTRVVTATPAALAASAFGGSAFWAGGGVGAATGGRGFVAGFGFFVGRPFPGGFVPAGPPFMGPESVASMHHAMKEAKRLGLDLGLITSSGWNAGGPWVPPELASKNLFVASGTVTGPAEIKVLKNVALDPVMAKIGWVVSELASSPSIRKPE